MMVGLLGVFIVLPHGTDDFDAAAHIIEAGLVGR
jgi:hypothetical protein